MSSNTGATVLYDTLADRRTLAKILLGFVVAGLLVYLLAAVVGFGAIRQAFARADPRWLALACLSTLVGLVAWTKAWQVVLSVVGIEVPFRRLVVTYLSGTFANYITPFGQAGGEPFIAFVLAQDTESSYEDSLAGVVIADLLNLLPFFNFAALGLATLLVSARLPAIIRPLAYGLTALAIAIPVIAYLGWNHREVVEAWTIRLLRPFLRRTSRVTVTGVRQRIDRFYTSLEVIAAEPRELAYALVFSYAGWLFFALPLYVSALTLGYHIAPMVVLFIVPASTIAGFVPTPGGLASVETALVVLLVALTALSANQAFALAMVYRLSSYWFALAVGGGATLWVIFRS